MFSVTSPGDPSVVACTERHVNLTYNIYYYYYYHQSLGFTADPLTLRHSSHRDRHPQRLPRSQPLEHPVHFRSSACSSAVAASRHVRRKHLRLLRRRLGRSRRRAARAPGRVFAGALRLLRDAAARRFGQEVEVEKVVDLRLQLGIGRRRDA